MSTSGGIHWIPPVPALPDVGAFATARLVRAVFNCLYNKGRQRMMHCRPSSFPALRRSRPPFHFRLRAWICAMARASAADNEA